ncbi:MAG TPA: 2-oxoacid:acceptor oxidoreductase family protein [Rhodocyclaceae bacterium]|nr:2-oxoacid:acceptor oxidoreductase family protein [Rhodocyclaceae bacterium]
MSTQLSFAAAWRQLLDAIVAAGGDGPAPVVLSSLPALDRLVEGAGPTPFGFVQGPPGRNVALAVGLRAAMPDAPIVLIMNADCVTLGTNHMIHAALRNIHMTLLLLRSELTAGDGAHDRTGWELPAWQRALENVPTPLDWATGLEAAFVGRATLRRPDELRRVVRDAIAVRGFSVVGITAETHLPTGKLSGNDWPEHYAAYRAWAAPLRREAEPALPPAPVARRTVPRLELRIAGLGGHGVKLAGTVLAEAAGIRHGLWATQRGEYGSATRGGPSMVDVVIGSDPITYPGADHPDVLVLLSQAAADRYAAGARPGAFVIADANEVKTLPAGAIPVPITALAREHAGRPIAAGIVALGCFAAVTDAVTLASIESAIQEHVPPRALAGNLAACAAGHAATLAAVKGEVCV